MGEQAAPTLSVLRTTAALFGEGGKIPSGTPCRGQQQDLGGALRSAGEVTSSTEADVCVGAAGRGSRGLLTQDVDETAPVGQDPHPEAQDHSTQDLEKEGGS